MDFCFYDCIFDGGNIMAKQAVAMKYGSGVKTLKSYIIGLVLSLVFTFTAFGLVQHHLLSGQSLYILLAALALLQLFAQVVFFLRMNVSPEGRWNTMPFLFTIVVVVIMVFGSLWIMYNLNYNMMH